jgi:RnfABCDGE-type electron transport complex G subunit
MVKIKGTNRFYPVAFLFIVLVIIISLISVTKNLSSTPIRFQTNETTLAMLQRVFPEVNYYYDDEEIGVYIIFDSQKHQIGYAFIVIGDGYGGDIRILVGLEVNKEIIRGITVLTHNEVLNEGQEYGSRLNFNSFVKQFVGLNINNCFLKSSGGEVDAITGATISSKAVVNAVRETALGKVKLINR